MALGCVGDSIPKQPLAGGVRWQLHSFCHDPPLPLGRPVRLVCLCPAQLGGEPWPQGRAGAEVGWVESKPWENGGRLLRELLQGTGK